MFDKLNSILALFAADRAEWSAAEVAAALQTPRSTTYRLMTRIADAGFLDQDEQSGRYRLGIRLAALGVLAQRSTSLQRAAYPELQRLAALTHETATLMVRGNFEGITIDVVDSLQPLMVPGLLGGHLPLHASAGGKVLLSWLSPAERAVVLRRPLAVHTASTITDVTALKAEIDQIRARGYATVRGEWVAEVFGAAAPIRNYSGAVIGAVTLGGPRSRVSDDRLRELVDAVVVAARHISSAVGFSGETGEPA
jgi:IclR family transcriptional regulator, KDG regulon repressor